MNAALVIMAAGLGSRYGGNKQVDGVGPNGEVLMEYSIHDAIRAGFTKVVFIVKPEILGLVRDPLRRQSARQDHPRWKAARGLLRISGFRESARVLYPCPPGARSPSARRTPCSARATM